MIHRRGIDRTNRRTSMDPFHLGTADYVLYRKVLCPWSTPSIEQLRYFLGFVHAQKSTGDELGPPMKLPSRLREL